MILKDEILIDLTAIESPNLLNQIYEFIQLVKKNSAVSEVGNRDEVLSLAGQLSDADAEEITATINNEFNKIEGEW